jgi:hypothetical protein
MSLQMPIAKSRASRLADVDPDIYQAFTALLASSTGAYPISREAVFRDEHDQCGASYSTFHNSSHHSLIYFHPNDCIHSHLMPAQVRAIFAHKRRSNEGQRIHEVFFAVHEYLRSDKNPFAPFVDFRAALFIREPDHRVQVIRATQVHCHANQRPWDDVSVVMRPIDRVSFISQSSWFCIVHAFNSATRSEK